MCARRMGEPHSCPRKLMGHQREHQNTQTLWLECYQRHGTLLNRHTLALGARLASCVINLVSSSKWPTLMAVCFY